MAFDAWYQPNKGSKSIVFVGCVHKTDTIIQARLAQVADNPLDYLIFTGDVTGSEELEDFKRLFYNHVYNRARGEIGIGTDADKNPSDASLLNYVGPNPPFPECTLKDGYISLMLYQHKLEGMDPSNARQCVEKLTDPEIAEGIRYIARDFEYYGPWVKTLPEVVRQGVMATLRQDAEKLLAAIKPIQDAGTKVVMVGGNWDDAQNTADNIIGKGIEVFDTVSFFRKNGVQFEDSIGYLITGRTVLVFLPYWELARENKGREARLAQAIAASNPTRASKTIIVVAHGAPTWQVHNPTATDGPTGERKIIIDTLGRFLAKIRPDEVVHGHEHNLLQTAAGKLLPLDTHYILQIDGDAVHPVSSPDLFGGRDQIIGSFLPVRQLGWLNRRPGTNPHPRLFGGDRDPVRIS